MKISSLIFGMVILCKAVLAQGFMNFDFELSTITSSSPTSYGFNTGWADVSGWTAYGDRAASNYAGGMAVFYNDQWLDSASVALVDSSYWNPALHGKYAILLFGGSNFAATTNGAAIGETGQIPLTAESITYWGASWNNQQNLQITFDGQLLSFIVISNTPTYTIYGADISAYAGQTGELLFTAPWQSYGNVIDRILFSSNPVPEPSTCVLISMGLVALLRTRRAR